MTEAKNLKKTRYQEALNVYGKAMAVMQKKDCKKAKELFSEFLEKFSSEVELADRVRIYISICDDKKTTAKVPLDTYEDYVNYAVFQMNSGDHDGALKSFEAAGKIKPKEGRVPYLISLAHFLAGNKKESLDYLNKAVKIDEYFAVMAQNESDFEPLWKDEEFKAITEG